MTILDRVNTLIKDILCLSNKDEVHEQIVQSVKGNIKIDYNLLYKSTRLYNVLKIYYIWKLMYNDLHCSKLLMNDIIKQNFNNDSDIIEYIHKTSFRKYISKCNIDDIKYKLKNFNCKEMFIPYLNNRYKLDIQKIESIFKCLLDAKIKFINNNSNYVINPITKNKINLLYELDLLLEDDIISYSFHMDHCFSRMLVNNTVIFINSQPTPEIIKFIECIKTNFIIITFNQDESIINIYRKHCIALYTITDKKYIDLIPDNLIKTFICINDNYKLGSVNYIINDCLNDFEPFVIEGNKHIVYVNSFGNMIDNKLTVIYPNLNIQQEILESMIKFMVENKIRQLIGYYYLLKIYKFIKEKAIINDNTGNNTGNNTGSTGNTGNTGNADVNTNNKTILVVDNRANPLNLITLDITLYNLENDWDITFIGSNKAISFMRDKYNNSFKRKINFISDYRLEYKFSMEDYNAILKDVDTYRKLQQLGYEKCLVIQDDSAVLKPGLDKSSFIDFDYVGSPWANAIENKELFNNMCGNGGFSLRNINKMIETIEKYSLEKNELFNSCLQIIPEDVYFSKYVKQIGKIPDNIDAMRFGSEQIMNKDSFGFHKIWAYHGDIISYFENYVCKYYTN